MGRHGPMPNPDSDRSKTGRNTLARTRNRTKPVTVTPPSSLKEDKVALAWWKAQAPRLIKAGRLFPEQAEAFAILCHIKADCDSLTRAVRATGWTVSNERGEQRNPLAIELRDKRRDFIALAKEFGLTAASDARIPDEAGDEEEADPKAAKFRAFIGA